MSLYTVVTVACDRCENEFKGPRHVKARPVRNAAKDSGWKVGKQKDFCPQCAEAIKQAVKEAASGA